MCGWLTAVNGRVEIALTDGGTLSAAQVNDLSVAGTANCYVVSAPGTYVFNARVRGNGAGEGVGFEPAIEMADGMTADWVHLPYEFLANVSNDIINKVKGVNRVVYDISSKPPATIEWE